MRPSLSGQLSVRAGEINKVCPNQANGESGNVRTYRWSSGGSTLRTLSPKLSILGISGMFWEVSINCIIIKKKCRDALYVSY